MAPAAYGRKEILQRTCTPPTPPTPIHHRNNSNQIPGEKSHLFAVLRVGEMDEIVIVHLLGIDDVAVFLLAQVFRVDPVGPKELLIGHAERLAYGLRNQLGLRKEGQLSEGGQEPVQISLLVALILCRGMLTCSVVFPRPLD